MKMNKRKIITIIIVVLLIAAVAGGAAYYLLAVKASSDSSATDTVDTVVLESGQSIVYAQLTSVLGNNITYLVAEKNEENSTYTATEETGELQIPVGTDVITKLGTTTTFVRLSTGNTIAMLMQGDDGVMKIWIVQ
ncbi:MAG: hypothetical protein LUE96_00250 [Lachnospiraceae bacterium]|nr:hypothetical protein [Lachnospiraceae bacterium]